MFGLVLFFLAFVGIDQSTRDNPLAIKLRRLDLFGVVLLVTSVSCLSIVLREGNANVSWKLPRHLGFFIIFGPLFFSLWRTAIEGWI